MALSCACGTQGRHSHLGAPFSGAESLIEKLRGGHFQVSREPGCLW